METALPWSCRTCMAEETADEVLDPDARLMLRVRGGDIDAFERLFSRHTRAMVNYAYRFVRNRETAEELAQEIFLRVYEGAADYQPQAKFTTWLYRIATNVCLNEIRKPRFRAAHQPISADGLDRGERIALEAGDEPERNLAREAISHALKQALEDLPENQRLAFVLNKYQELSYAEAAEIMGTSEKAVKSLIHRAKEALAEKLKPLLPGLIDQ